MTYYQSWGESAGAISVSLHMLANGGNNEGLFRAAFMQSGSPLPLGDITEGQPHYDALVEQTGCTGSADTLECLRALPFDVLKAAVDKSPGIFDYQVLFLPVKVLFFVINCSTSHSTSRGHQERMGYS